MEQLNLSHESINYLNNKPYSILTIPDGVYIKFPEENITFSEIYKKADM